jgi:O-acetyl-ADP-ribose deacetylase (regulator of RNase III)
MIREVSGDILLSGAQAVAHGVAPHDHFASGLALALRELHKLVLKEKFTSLALPRLATGVGGLDWEDVRPLIDSHLGNLDIPVILYRTYQSGVKAAE